MTLPSEKVKVVFCDVGQGDATLVTYKNWQMLIDTGPNNKKVLSCLDRHMPFWDKTIEVLLVTHGDSDHSGGVVDLFKYYEIVDFFDNGDLEEVFEQKYYPIKLNVFDTIKFGLITFEIVNSGKNDQKEEDRNSGSVAGILSYKDIDSGETKKIFMAADIDLKTERRLVWQGVLRQDYGTLGNGVDVLKVSHHGSKNGTSEELLEILKPKMAVISVGEKNRYGHPTKEILDRLKEKVIQIKRTDVDGEILFID